MRTATVIMASAGALALAACAGGSSAPDRDPEAVGTVEVAEHVDGTSRIAFVPDGGYEYFEGTTFVIDDEVTVGGAATSASAIEAGDRLEVWTGECAESFPVQCAVEHVEVLD